MRILTQQGVHSRKILLYVCLALVCLPARLLAQSQEEKDFLVSDYLTTVSSKLGCYFTVEYADRSGETPSYMENRITNDANVTTIPQLIAYLRRSLKGVVVEPDTKNPKIVHLIDEQLKKDTNYVLNKQISLNYSGTLMESGADDPAQKNKTQPMTLIEAAEAKVKPSLLADESQAWYTSPSIWDSTTHVTVNATNESVRAIFSDCLPLVGYHSFLWEAHAWTAKSKTIVFVQFGGPKR